MTQNPICSHRNWKAIANSESVVAVMLNLYMICHCTDLITGQNRYIMMARLEIFTREP
ncbi:hypothetical protein VB620_18210 [Nodularia harveyana UHCC-0300]|uniref:Uncharacterized protein n=1 Tax=Nodularia harveyana UHCC-0300 TaxID=2974287 RepID=A0ABU5UJY7_9CYAN|nr:hypothetical protein [Nodularia harveyana]MEA5583266.1 hypothetical protein [Nodularia harveyana UHCC-0300]